MGSTAPPYTEVWKCSVYPIPIEEHAPVSWIEYQQTEGTHHMTLSTPADRARWYNETDAMVPYGLNSQDEMCNLAIVHTPFKYLESRLLSGFLGIFLSYQHFSCQRAYG